MKKVTIHTLLEKKRNRQKITWLTGYDYPMAQVEEKAGIDIILVGDSMGMTVYGWDSTLPVTMDLLIPHTKAVRKGAPNVFLIGDMPYMSYQVSTQEAVRNAGRFMAECACDAVKLEGGREVIDTVKALVKATIPTVGHLGLTPQSIAMFGGFKAQGRDVDAAMGIGAGPHVDGQCLIVHDMLGMFEAFTPKFVKKYTNISQQIVEALKVFIEDVNKGGFPGPEHCYKMPEEDAQKLEEMFREK
jgi:3-methyl-2-oxobutanoate hydroxymethyltransferase